MPDGVDNSAITAPTSPLAAPAFPSYHPVMPKPGQPGALFFDGENITNFLDEWNVECKEYSYTDEQKCSKFPYHADSKYRDIIENLDGYATSNWATFQANLKSPFWQQDEPKNTTAALYRLINEAQTGKIDLNVHVLALFPPLLRTE
jgi:hypothetical protein